MEKDIYDKSVATGELKLKGWDYLTHFSIVFFLLFIVLAMLVVVLVWFFKGATHAFQGGVIWVIMVPLALLPIFYWIQKRKLRFQTVKTQLNHAQIKKIIDRVGAELKWKFLSSSSNVYIARTDPGFFSGSWGERITILIYEDNVFVNSICDPGKQASIVSFGRNHKNEEALIDAIKEAGN